MSIHEKFASAIGKRDMKFLKEILLEGEEADIEEPPDLDRLSRRDWILLLLYAPDDLGVSAAVRGEFSLSLGLFLLSKKANRVEATGPFNFEKSKRGPLDTRLTEELDYLVNKEFIRRQPISEEDGYGLDNAEYDITSKGEKHAGSIFERLLEEQREAVESVKQEFLLGDTSDLILEALRHGDQYFAGNLIRR